MQDNPPLESVGEIFSQVYCQQGHCGNLSKRMTWQMKGIWKFMLFTSTSPIQHCMLCTFACVYISPLQKYISYTSIGIKVSVTQCQIHRIMLKQWGKRWILQTYIHTYMHTNIHRVGYARMNVIGSRTLFVIASVHSSIQWNICI